MVSMGTLCTKFHLHVLKVYVGLTSEGVVIERTA